MVHCALNCMNLENETIHILECHYFYNKKAQQEKNFKHHVTKIENMLRIWKMRQLTLEGKIMDFTSLAISKIIHFALRNSVSRKIIDFLQKNSKPKIKHKPLTKIYKHRGSQNVDISEKINCFHNVHEYKDYLNTTFMTGK